MTAAPERRLGLSGYTLDELERARRAVLEDLAAIEAVLRRNGRLGAAPGLGTPATPGLGTPNLGKAVGGHATRYDWAEGRRLWEVEGFGAPKIAAALGCTMQSVYNHAKAEGWAPRGRSGSSPEPAATIHAPGEPVPPARSARKPERPAPPAPPPRRPDVPKKPLPKPVLCDWCQLYTSTDPCAKCHRPPNRYA